MWPLVLFIASLLLLYSFLQKSASQLFASLRGSHYWKQRGIPEIDPSSAATELDLLLGRKDITERDNYVYQIMKGRQMSFCGVIESTSPIILIKDVDLLKKVLVKHFDHFIDRRPFFGAARENSILRKMLGNLQGEEWKRVRSSVTPIFTSGKIRRMIGCINAVCQEWVKQLSMACDASDGRFTVNVLDSVRKYTADVIASAIFGLDAATLQNPNSIFSAMATRLTEMGTFQRIKFTLSLRFPKLFQLFDISFLDMEALRFFEDLLKDRLQLRMQNIGNTEFQYSDFLQLLVEARRGDLRELLTDHIMTAQCLSFFFAGFRTTSHLITFALYALALHPEIQTKVREEVAGVINEGYPLDYDRLASLIYMDMVICEVLRKFPAALRLERMCVTEYQDPETELRVPKGAIVTVPLYSIHHDNEFYERPHDFYPEHFTTERKAQRSQYAFMPFGAGPRNCIGMRFALLESKAALAHILQNFIVEPTEKTPTPLTGLRTNFQISPPPNLELALIPI